MRHLAAILILILNHLKLQGIWQLFFAIYNKNTNWIIESDTIQVFIFIPDSSRGKYRGENDSRSSRDFCH